MPTRTACFVIVSAVVLGACATARPDGVELGSRPPAARIAPEEQPHAPTRDGRDPSADLLALIEEQRGEIETLRSELVAARSSAADVTLAERTVAERESALLAQIGRLEQLLEVAGSREQQLQDELIAARLDAVRAKQALYRAEIEALGQREDR